MEEIAFLKKDPYLDRYYVKIPKGEVVTSEDSTKIVLASARLVFPSDEVPPTIAYLTSRTIQEHGISYMAGVTIDTKKGDCTFYHMDGGIDGIYNTAANISSILEGTQYPIVDVPNVEIQDSPSETLSVYPGPLPEEVMLPSLLLNQEPEELVGVPNGSLYSQGHAVAFMVVTFSYVVRVELLAGGTVDVLYRNTRFITYPGYYINGYILLFPLINLYQRNLEILDVIDQYPNLGIDPISLVEYIGAYRLSISQGRVSFQINSKSLQGISPLLDRISYNNGQMDIRYVLDGDVSDVSYVREAMIMLNSTIYQLQDLEVYVENNRVYISRRNIPAVIGVPYTTSALVNCRIVPSITFVIDPLGNAVIEDINADHEHTCGPIRQILGLC